MPSNSPTDQRVLAIRPPFVPIIVDHDTIQFRIGPWAGESFTVADHDGEQRLAALIPLLNGHYTEREILEEFSPNNRAEIRSLMNRLGNEGVIVEVTDQPVDGLGGYLTLQPGVPASQTNYRDSRVLVVNHGHIGRMLLEDFTAADIRGITLYDPALDRSNLPASVRRQVTELTSFNEVKTVIHDADCVVYAEDNPRPAIVTEINDLALEAETPWITGRVHGLDGIVGPTMIPGATCCYQCYRARATANVDGPINYRAVEEALEATAFNSPVSYARIIAGYLVVDVLNLLRGGTAFTAGRIVRFNFFDLSVESNAVLKLPRCTACTRNRKKVLDWQRFTGFDQLLGEDDP